MIRHSSHRNAPSSRKHDSSLPSPGQTPEDRLRRHGTTQPVHRSCVEWDRGSHEEEGVDDSARISTSEIQTNGCRSSCYDLFVVSGRKAV